MLAKKVYRDIRLLYIYRLSEKCLEPTDVLETSDVFREIIFLNIYKLAGL